MKPSHIFLLVLVVALWGINFVFVKIGLQELPPMLLCFARFFIVSIPAVFFFKPPSAPFKYVALYSLVMFVFQFVLMFYGMHIGVSAGLASLLLQTQVVFSIIFASLFLKEKLNRWQVFGSILSFTGISVVGGNLGASATLPGLFLVLSAAATWGGGSIIVKMMGKTKTSSLLVWSSLLAWPPLLLLSLFFENSHPLVLNFHQLAPQTYVAILFIVLCSTVFGFGVWNWMVQLYPITTVAPFTLLVPIFGMVSSMIWLGEELEAWKILAGLLVIGGLAFNLLGTHLKKLVQEAEDKDVG